jgi:20S proteasome alpha/beta subunit
MNYTLLIGTNTPLPYSLLLLIQYLYFSTVIGLRGKDGVVLAVEKLVTSKLYEVGANKRIFTIDEHVGMVI